MDTLRGRTVVILGASSGIGLAAAEAFAREGANLVLTSRRAEPLEAAARRCRRFGVEAVAAPADVRDAAAVRRVAEVAVERFGGVDVWINNAGVGAIGAFSDVPIEVHQATIGTNLIGMLNGAHAILPHFKARGAGVMINTLSVGAWAATPYAAAYAAAKFGARAAMAAIRAELRHARNIHVCDLYPTIVNTPGFTHAGQFVGRRPHVTGGMDARRVADRMVRLALDPRATTPMGGLAPHLARLGFGIAPGIAAAIGAWAMERAIAGWPRGPNTAGAVIAPIREGVGIDGPRGLSPTAGLLAGALALGLLAASTRSAARAV